MIQIVPIDFLGQPGMLTPSDPKIHDMALEYCARELAESVNLSELSKCWLAVKDDVPVGIMGYVLKPDIPVMRATDAEALLAMAERLQSYFADMGCRGKEVLVHLSKAEKPEQRCDGWREALVSQGAKPADRFIVVVR